MNKLILALFITTFLSTIFLFSEVKYVSGYAQQCYNKGKNCNYRQRNYYSERSYYAEASYYAQGAYSGGTGGGLSPTHAPPITTTRIPCNVGEQDPRCANGYLESAYGTPNEQYFGSCGGDRAGQTCRYTQGSYSYNQSTYGGGYNQTTYGGNTGSVVVLTFADLNNNNVQDNGEPGIGDLGLSLQGGTTNQSTTTNPAGAGQFSNLSTTGSYNLTVSGFGTGLLLTGSNPRAVSVQTGGSVAPTNTNSSPTPTGTSNNTTTQNPFQQFIDWLYGVFGR